jgi:DNA-directed RNA polymerase specialized sigma24 family protein
MNTGFEWRAPESSNLMTRLECLLDGEHDRLAQLVYERVFDGCQIRDLAKKAGKSERSLKSELQEFAVRYLV